MNDVEEKYYADGENAYDMRKHFKQSASKSTFPAKQSKPVTDKASEMAADKATEKDASEQSSDAQAAPPAQEKASEPQTENGVADSEKENSNNGGPPEAKASQGKGKSTRSKKR